MKTALEKYIKLVSPLFTLLYKTITNTTIVNDTVLIITDLKHLSLDICMTAIKKFNLQYQRSIIRSKLSLQPSQEFKKELLQTNRN